MADNFTTQATHLANLDLDITGIKTSLEQAQQEIEAAAQKAKETWNNALNGDSKSGTGTGSEKTNNAIHASLKAVESLNTAFKQLQNTIAGEKISGAEFNTLADDINNAAKSVEDLSNSFESNKKLTEEEQKQFAELSVELIQLKGRLADIRTESKQDGENVVIAKTAQQITEFNSKLLSVEKQYTNFITSVTKANIDSSAAQTLITAANNTINAVKGMREEISKTGEVTVEQSQKFTTFKDGLTTLSTTFSQLKTSAEQQRQALKDIIPVDETITKIEKLTKAYSEFQLKLSASNLTPAALGTLPKDAQSARDALEKLKKEISETGVVTNSQNSQIDNLNNILVRLKTTFNDTNAEARRTGTGFKTMGEKAKSSSSLIADFMQKLSDKAKWLLAFRFITLIESAFKQVIPTIKETEDSVIALQRVLSDENLANSAIADELYNIAEQYGQTFDVVQEVALRFAQSGQSWNEVIASTEATMLGLNTAELEVSTATEGLIAVMAQFDKEATDLNLIIDEINKTADNFPVTSEKIVAALQRVGSTASNAGLDLEQTIALITALSEATGRSGENIGTALNSLLIYTKKEKSLNVFAGLSDELAQVVDDFNKGKASIVDIWSALSDYIQDSNGYIAENISKLNQALISSGDYNDFVSELESNSADTIEALNSIYTTAGTFRQNYFIALLNNMQTYTNAMENMIDSEGYSLNQNQQYMQTLTAYTNNLKTAAKELAVQFGEMGFLDLAKGVVQLTTSFLKLSKELGGIRTAIPLVTIAFVAFRKEKSKFLQINIADSIHQMGKRFEGAALAILQGEVKLKAFNVQAALSKMTVGGLISVVSVFGAAISAISAKIDAYNEKQKEMRQEAIENGKGISDEVSSLSELYEQYTSANEQYDKATTSLKNVDNAKSDLTTTSNALLKALGAESETISNLEGQYGRYAVAIKNATAEKITELAIQVSASRVAAEQAFKDIEKLSGDTERKLVSTLGREQYQAFLKLGNNAESAQEKIDLLTEAMNKLMSPDNWTEDSKTVVAVNEILNQITALKSALSDVEYFKQLENIFAEAQNGGKSIEWLAEQIDELNGVTKETEPALGEAEQAIADYDSALEKLAETYKLLSQSVDDFQSAYKTIQDVISDYNETGYLSADMLQKLLELEPEYIEMLEVKGNALSINAAQVENLVNANELYMQQMAATRIEEYLTQLQQDATAASLEGLTLAEYQSANAAATLGSDAYNLALQFIQGKISTEDFGNQLSNLPAVASLAGDSLSYLTNQVFNYASSVKSLLGLAGGGLKTFYTPTVSSGSSSGGGGSSSSGEKKELQTEIKLWQEKKQEVQDYYDNQIDALKSVQDANDRINDQLDYYNNRQKKITNLEQVTARSGIEYREKEMEYQQDLIDLESEWQDKLNDWSIDDQIDQLKLLKEQSVAEIEEIIDELQDKVSSLSSSTGGGIASGVSSGLNYASDALDTFGSELDEEVQEEAETLEQTATDTATSLLEIYETEFTKPLYQLMLNTFDDISQVTLNSAIQNAKNIYMAYYNNWIYPLRSQIASITRGLAAASSYAKTASGSVYNNANYNTSNNANVYANITGLSAANATTQQIYGAFDISTNPNRF